MAGTWSLSFTIGPAIVCVPATGLTARRPDLGAGPLAPPRGAEQTTRVPLLLPSQLLGLHQVIKMDMRMEEIVGLESVVGVAQLAGARHACELAGARRGI